MKSIIPLEPLPSQTLKCKLAEQNCEIRVYYRFGHTYADLVCDGTPAITGAICHDRLNIIQIQQSIFKGSLYFADKLGAADPQYTGFGYRWVLIYNDGAAV